MILDNSLPLDHKTTFLILIENCLRLGPSLQDVEPSIPQTLNISVHSNSPEKEPLTFEEHVNGSAGPIWIFKNQTFLFRDGT